MIPKLAKLVLKGFLTLCLFFCLHHAQAQTGCNCPAPGTCEPCQGGITQLTLVYTGSSQATVSVFDNLDIIFLQTLAPGEQFVLDGSNVNGTFISASVGLFVNGFFSVNIKTSCALAFDPSVQLGVFKIVAAKSRNGGTLCCTANAGDTTPPAITGCPGNINVDITSGCTAVATWTVPEATDCNLVSFTSTAQPGSSFPVGRTVVTYTATDFSNNISTCRFDVTVKDNLPPVVTDCPTTITLDADANCKAKGNWKSPLFVDNCGAVTVTRSHSPGDEFSLGTTHVTYTGEDAAGNKTECKFDVIVKDVTAPMVSDCPTDITVNANASCVATVNWAAPAFSDNCSPVTVTRSHNSGDNFPLGTTVVTYTGKDAAGNTTICSFKVIVKDVTAPVVTNCPTNITVAAGENCKAAVPWTAPVFTDNCSVTVTSTHNPGSQFSLGTTAVTYTGKDAAGNTTLCKFNVIVKDQTAPVTTSCPSDISVSTGVTCKGVATWTPPVFTDNCSAVTVTSTHTPGAEFAKGTTTVTYTAKDAAGNTSLCSFKVTVTDQTPPVVSNCPANITVPAVDACEAKATWTAPSFVDNCGPVTITKSHQSGDIFPVGSTTVTYSATDQAGNVTTCSFDVSITNDIAPVITGCPENIVVPGINAHDAVPVTWDEPSVTDDCLLQEVTQSHSSGDLFPVGTTSVTIVAKDFSGNMTECSFDVTVLFESLELDVSQIVTPDGNGLNDYWAIGNIERYKTNRVVIADRWGSVIYTASGYNNASTSWTGLNPQGNAVPTGTYFYTISVQSGESSLEQHGFIELVR